MTKQQLIEDNMNLVYFIINKYYPKYINDEDIVQCGMVGLCQAADKWDEQKGAFSTYASRSIRHTIRNEFVRYRNKHKDVLSLDYEYKTIGDDEPSTLGDSIVGEDGVDIVDYDALYKKLNYIQQKIFDYKINGYGTKEIAKKTGLSIETVCKHIRIIKIKWEMVYGDDE